MMSLNISRVTLSSSLLYRLTSAAFIVYDFIFPPPRPCRTICGAVPRTATASLRFRRTPTGSSGGFKNLNFPHTFHTFFLITLFRLDVFLHAHRFVLGFSLSLQNIFQPVL